MKPSKVRGRTYSGEAAVSWGFARFVRATLGNFLLWAFKVELKGWENVPSGGVIFAGNHESYLDPVLLWCAVKRPTHFVAKAELWDGGLLGWLLDRLYALPVRRGSADREMLGTAGAILEAGEPVGLFPEGTRKREVGTEELGEAHGGAAFLAIRSGVPVVPVGIVGTGAAWPPGRKLPKFVPVSMLMLEPVSPDDFSGTRKERVEAMTAEIMRRIVVARNLVRRG